MTQLSVGKVMANMYWNSEEVIHVDFLPLGVTGNAQHTVTCFALMCAK
jgi:hypothetical protein